MKTLADSGHSLRQRFPDSLRSLSFSFFKKNGGYVCFLRMPSGTTTNLVAETSRSLSSHSLEAGRPELRRGQGCASNGWGGGGGRGLCLLQLWVLQVALGWWLHPCLPLLLPSHASSSVVKTLVFGFGDPGN